MATYEIGISGDYTTIQAWEDASPATLSALYEGTLLPYQSHGHPSNSQIALMSGVTADATNYMQLTYDGTAYHGGDPYDAAAPLISGTEYSDNAHQHGLDVQVAYTRIVGVHLTGAEGGLDYAVKCNATDVRIYECIMSSVLNYPIRTVAPYDAYIRNVLQIYCGGVLRGLGLTGANDIYMYHVSAHHIAIQGGGTDADLSSNYDGPIYTSSGAGGYTILHIKNCYIDLYPLQYVASSTPWWEIGYTQNQLILDDSTHVAGSGVRAYGLTAIRCNEGWENTTGNELDWYNTSSNMTDNSYATSSVTGAPGDWGDYCGQNNLAASGVGWCDWGLNLDHRVLYLRFDFILEADSMGNNEWNKCGGMWDSGWGPMYADVGRNGSGTLQLKTVVDHNGSGGSTYYTDISLDTRYIVELKWDSVNDVWEWRLDGTSKNNGTITTTNYDEIRQIIVGSQAGADQDAAHTIYYDHFQARSDTWCKDADFTAIHKHSVTPDLTTEIVSKTMGEDGAKDYAPASPVHDCYVYQNTPDTNRNTDGLYVSAAPTTGREFGIRWGLGNLPDPLCYLTSVASLTRSFGQTTGATKRAQPFTPDAAGTSTAVRVRVQKIGNPTDNLRISIQTDSSGDPSGTVVGTLFDLPGTLLTTSLNTLTVPVGSGSLSASTQYHLVLERTGSLDDANYYDIAVPASGGYGTNHRLLDGTWSAGSYPLKFTVITDTYIRHAAFYVYQRTGSGGNSSTLEQVITRRPTTPSTWDETTITWNTGRPTAFNKRIGLSGWIGSGAANRVWCNLNPCRQTVLDSYSEDIDWWVDADTFTGWSYADDGEYATAGQRPYMEFHLGKPDYSLPATQTDLYKWGADLSADSAMPVTIDITGASRYWNSCGAFDGPPPNFGEVAETASFRSAVEFQIAYPTSDQNEVGTWIHATTATLYEAVDDVLGVDDADVIDSP